MTLSVKSSSIGRFLGHGLILLIAIAGVNLVVAVTHKDTLDAEELLGARPKGRGARHEAAAQMNGPIRV